MIRVEVIANRSVEEDFFDGLRAAELNLHYTLFPEVYGTGAAGPRRGDHIWPEENFVFVCYADMATAQKLAGVVSRLRERFPDEGVQVFATQGIDLEE
jgi:hypothetical protein